MTTYEQIDTSSIDNGLRKTPTASDIDYNIQIDNELKAYARHLASLLPPQVQFNPEEKIFEQLKNGIVLAYVLYEIKSNCIDLKRLVMSDQMLNKKGIYESTANLALVLGAAKKIGIKVVNIGPEDILYENKCLILGLLWQIVRMSVSRASNVLQKPELIGLIEDNESIEELCSRSPEELCLRWINFHLDNVRQSDIVKKIKHFQHDEIKESSAEEVQMVFEKCYVSDVNKTKNTFCNKLKDIPEKITNFSKDLKNSKVYLLLLKNIAGDIINDDEFLQAWFDMDIKSKAAKIIEFAKRIECDNFITEDVIIKGDHRLNFLFAQTIMNKYPGMENQVISIEALKEKISEYESNISVLRDNLVNITNDLANKESIKRKQELFEEELLRKIEDKSHEYENVIEDLKASYDSFAFKVGDYVENNVGITFSKERIDSKERLWGIITGLLTEIKVSRSERDDAILKLEAKKEIDKVIEMKILEYVEIQKKKQIKKKGRTFREIFGCK